MSLLLLFNQGTQTTASDGRVDWSQSLEPRASRTATTGAAATLATGTAPSVKAHPVGAPRSSVSAPQPAPTVRHTPAAGAAASATQSPRPQAAAAAATQPRTTTTEPSAARVTRDDPDEPRVGNA